MTTERLRATIADEWQQRVDRGVSVGAVDTSRGAGCAGADLDSLSAGSPASTRSPSTRPAVDDLGPNVARLLDAAVELVRRS